MRNLFFRLEEFGNICGTNFCDLGPKSQKFVPQKLMAQYFMPAKINALKVMFTSEVFKLWNTISITFKRMTTVKDILLIKVLSFVKDHDKSITVEIFFASKLHHNLLESSYLFSTIA